MNYNRLESTNDVVHAIGLTIIDNLWQGLIIGIMLFVLLSFVKVNAARMRYTLSILAMLMMFLWAGNSFIHHFGAIKDYKSQVKNVAYSELNRIDMEQFATSSPETILSEEKGGLLKYLQTNLYQYSNFIVTCWGIGVLLLLLKLIGSLVYVNKLRESGLDLVEQNIKKRLSRLTGQLGLVKIPKLMESALVNAPLTLGYIQPVIIFPVGMMTGVPIAQLESILIHELVHIKKADYFVNLVQSFIEVLFFYHPATWYISKVIGKERERRCDEITVSLIDNPLPYAKALTAIHKNENYFKPQLTMSAQSGKGEFTMRIFRIMNINNPRPYKNRVLATFLVLLLGVSLLSFYVPTQAVKISGDAFANNLDNNDVLAGIDMPDENKDESDDKEGDDLDENVVVSNPLRSNESTTNLAPRKNMANQTNGKREKQKQNLTQKFDSSGKIYLSKGKTIDTIYFSLQKAGNDTIIHPARDKPKLIWTITPSSRGHYDKEGLTRKTYITEITIKKPGSADTTYASEIEYFVAKKDTEPLFYLNDKRITKELLKDLLPDEIESISVIKGKQAIELYGEEAKKGVILIYTKDFKGQKPEKNKKKEKIKIKVKEKKEKRTVLLELDPTDSISFNQGQIRIYGNVTVKDEIHLSPGNSILTVTAKQDNDENDPLLIIDGRESEMNMQEFKENIMPDDIQSIAVYKDINADLIKDYGEKAKKGVILITTKNEKTGQKKAKPSKFNSQLEIFPNPSDQDVNIRFRLDTKSKVNISVYDMNGKLVENILSEILDSGPHSIKWSSGDVPGGNYIIHVHNGEFRFTRNVLVRD